MTPPSPGGGDAHTGLFTFTDRITLIEHDYRTMIPHLPPVDVVLTDPPYVWYDGMLAFDAQGYLDDNPVEAVWPVFTWMWQWVPLLLARVRQTVWLTSDRRYLPFYRHFLPATLTMTDWPVLDDGTGQAHLVHIGPAPLPCPPPATLAAYRYGSDSPVAFWAGLLAATPTSGGVLLDPFCGTGSALEAGVEAGYRVVGIEHRHDTFARLQRRMIAVDARQAATNGVSSGLTGPSKET